MDDFKIVEKILKNTKGSGGEKFFSEKFASTEKVKLLPDSLISPAKFKKHAFLLNHYHAHPETIRALKSDLFLLGGDFIDLEQAYRCESCHFDLDLQFWRHCPRCGAKFAADISKAK
jgi:hypothetical protein